MSLIIEILSYIIIIGLLLALPYLNDVFPNLKVEHILIALVTVVAGSYLNLNQQFRTLKKKLSFLGLERIFYYDSFGKAINFVENQIHVVNNLRIYDISTRNIYPAISSGTLHIKKCTLILRDFYLNDPNRDDSLITEIDLNIKKWMALKDEKKVDELYIYRFYDNPTDYMCLFDDKFLISGQYISEPDNIKSLTPMLVTSETKPGSDMIVQFLGRFENLIEMSKFHSSKPAFYGNILGFAKRTVSKKVEIFLEEIKQSDFIAAIGIANNELTADLSVDFYRDFFVNRNGKLKIMFAKPQCEQIISREKHENRANGSLSFFILHNIEDLNSYISQCGNISCDYQIRVYDFYPKTNCIITNNYVFVHYYGQASRGLDVPTFVISKEENPDIYDYYMSEFESLWALGVDYPPISS